MKIRSGWMWTVVLITSIPPLTPLTAAAQAWPQWRGPHRDGAVEGFTAPAAWPDTLQRVWRVPVGTGHASPVIAGNRVYVLTRRNDEEVMSCLALDTGALLWRTGYAAPYQMNPAARSHGKGPKSTPVIHDGRVYTLGISGILSCFDADTGALLWQKTFADQFSDTSPLYGAAMSPLIEDRLLIVHLGGHDQGALIAFDEKSGMVRWRWDEDGPAYASPVVLTVDGAKQVVTQTQHYGAGFSLTTGRILWRIPFRTPYDQNIVTPIIYRDMVIFSGLEQGTTAIRVIRERTGWSTERVWHNPQVSMYMSSPVCKDYLLFGLSHLRRGQFFCLDARTGSTLWASEGRQGENAALVRAGDVIFCLTTEAELIVLHARADRFVPLVRYTVADSPTWSHPAILNQAILIKDASTLTLWKIGADG